MARVEFALTLRGCLALIFNLIIVLVVAVDKIDNLGRRAQARLWIRDLDDLVISIFLCRAFLSS